MIWFELFLIELFLSLIQLFLIELFLIIIDLIWIGFEWMITTWDWLFCSCALRTMADPRWLDLTIDPNDRSPAGECFLGECEQANDMPTGIARFWFVFWKRKEYDLCETNSEKEKDFLIEKRIGFWKDMIFFLLLKHTM